MKKTLTRTTGTGAIFLGVCGGLGKYFSIDPTLVRIAYALFIFFSVGVLIPIYFILAFIMPNESQV